MADIEKHNPQLAGGLPRNYQIFNGTLLKELLKKVSEIPVSLDYDAFGRIYEYFLGQFVRTEGQKGGEFYTPAPIVRLIVEILEPFHGCILDPACGSGGMFVQSARFVAEHKKNPSSELSIFGVEKTDCRRAICCFRVCFPDRCLFPDYPQEDAAGEIIRFEFAANESILALDLAALLSAAAPRQGYFQCRFEPNHPLGQAF